jgi:hypothetical protein
MCDAIIAKTQARAKRDKHYVKGEMAVLEKKLEVERNYISYERRKYLMEQLDSCEFLHRYLKKQYDILKKVAAGDKLDVCYSCKEVRIGG